MDASDFDGWVKRYIRAWDSNDPDDIIGLFSTDAAYLTAPHRAPWKGQEAIVNSWIDRKDEPGDHEFRWEVLGVDGDIGFVRGWTRYPGQDPEAYGNLWVIRLGADGRAAEFTEWWMAEGS
ncbi:MAG: ketosteroid isomerase family protein [Candidatus Dormibacteraeota bacterium]|nr:ketosteroid isomerase family protein [Candidatus Dormibacteraeota bacterium]